MQDVEHGRLFRVAPPGTPSSIPSYELGNPNGAIAALESPNLAWRYLGWQALMNFGPKAEAPLTKMFQSAAPNHRARALWILGQLKIGEEKRLNAIRLGLKSPDPDVRCTAIRLIREVRDEIDVAQVIPDLNIDDPAPEVRREILLGLRDVQPESLPGTWAKTGPAL